MTVMEFSQHGAPPMTNIWRCAQQYNELAAGIQQRNAEILARLHPRPAAVHSGLEIGCGTGFLTRVLVDQYKELRQLLALDISADMLDLARMQISSPRVEFVQVSILDYQPATVFDCVFSNAAFHWLYPHYKQALAKVHALLRTGGYFLLATAGRSTASDMFDDDMARCIGPASPSGITFRQRRLRVIDLESLASATGFAVEEAFVLERTFRLAASLYARWLVASGDVWKHDRDADPETTIQRLSCALGGPDSTVHGGHWSLIAVLRKQ